MGKIKEERVGIYSMLAIKKSIKGYQRSQNINSGEAGRVRGGSLCNEITWDSLLKWGEGRKGRSSDIKKT